MIKRIENYSVSPRLLQFINVIEKFQAVWDHTVYHQSPHFIKGLQQTTIITSSGSSTRIEGAMLSDKEVEELIKRGCKISKMSSRSEREVSGYVKALSYIYKSYKDIPFTEKSLREVHQILTVDLLEEHLPSNQRGAYKNVPNDVVERNEETGEERVWFSTTPPGPQTASEMKALIEEVNYLFTNNLQNKLLIIAAFVVHFLAIHPFRDGNGRLSRLLTIWLLLRCGYSWVQYSSHEKVIEDNKTAYYVSLRRTQQTLKLKKPDYESWFTYFLMIISRQTHFISEKLKKESPKSELNSNESRVYEVIKEHGRVTPSFLRQYVDMTPSGLKTLLQRLSERDLIEPIGEKRGRKYQLKKFE